MSGLLLRLGVFRTLEHAPTYHPKMIKAKPNTSLAEVEAQMQETYDAIWAAPTLAERDALGKKYADLKKEYERLTQRPNR